MIINANQVIFQLLSSDADLVATVGTYSDGGASIVKIFSVLPPLREGQKADLPMITFTKMVEVDHKHGRSTNRDLVTVELFVHSREADKADLIARKVRGVLDHYQSPQIATIDFVKQDHEIIYDIEGDMVCVIPMIFKLKINY